jgi:release factor glutamine methyltransferase
MKQPSWTVLDLLQWSTEYLQASDVPEARLSSEWLLCHVLTCDRFQLYLDFERLLNQAELQVYKSLLLRRKRHEPLQYIIGESSFYGSTLKLDARVLIPRPETEQLVALIHSQTRAIPAGIIADLGTGSGAIAIALAKCLPQWRFIATDVSEKALALAGENARNNGVAERIAFYLQDMRESLLPYGRQANIIVANPPYVKASDMATLASQVRDYEPREALTDGADGLTYYRLILSRAKHYLCQGESNIYLELGDTTVTDGLLQLANSHNSSLQIKKDYAGKDRFAIIKL